MGILSSFDPGFLGFLFIGWYLYLRREREGGWALFVFDNPLVSLILVPDHYHLGVDGNHLAVPPLHPLVLWDKDEVLEPSNGHHW